MISPSHFVFKENTFGYLFFDGVFIVMSVDVERGGDPTLIDRTISVSEKDLRPAVAEDYKHFRIRWPWMNP